jgi:tetratricopeptide (TPR) repeat protein
MRSAEVLRLLVLASYRDTDLDVTAQLSDAVADLLRQPGVERFRLQGLDENDLADFMAARGRQEVDDETRAWAAALHTETGGNPFFVGQVIRHLSETGAVFRRDGRWTIEATPAELEIPEGVREVIGQRLGRLPEETRETLAVAAVLGDRFELEVLAHATGEAEIATLRALDPAIAARLVTEAATPAPGHRFLHTLVRATLYEALPAARRLELHGRCGEAIEAIHQGRRPHLLPALAHHFARAGGGQRRKALEYSTRAGERALALLANDEAAGWFGRALDVLDALGSDADETRRCDLLISLGEAQRRAGNPAHRQTLLDAAHLAERLGDAERLAGAALANTRFIFSRWGRVDAERTAVLEAALAAVGPEDSALRARLLANLAVELTWSPDRDRPPGLVREALQMASRLDDSGTAAQVAFLSQIPTLAAVEPDPPQYEELRSRLTAAIHDVDDRAIQAWYRFIEAVRALRFGDLATADDQLVELSRLADEVSEPLVRWVVIIMKALRAMMAGRFDEAEALCHEGLELGADGSVPDAAAIFGGQLFGIRYDQGRIDEVLGAMARAAARPESMPYTRASLAVAFCELGRPEEARPFLDELAADGFGSVFRYDQIMVFGMLAQVCADLGDRQRAAELYDLLIPQAGRLNCTWGIGTGPSDHHLGLLATTLGEYDRADEHFAEAARFSELVGAPGWLARSRLEWARMLQRRGGPGDQARARELAGQALAAAEELGMARIEAQARGIVEVS